MPKLPVVSGAEAVRAFERLGYTQTRQSGSHVRMKAEGRPSLTVPLHDTLKRGTLRSLLHDADITVERFRENL